MTDTKLLCDKIEESGYRMHYLAKQLGLSYQGFLNKRNNQTEFKASEIFTLKSLLNIGAEDLHRIFFAPPAELKSATAEDAA